MYNSEFLIGDLIVGINRPTCFIADIAANHDGSLSRAIDLIHLAKESGADIAKFQHFQANTIVSDKGFKDIGRSSHQAAWKKSVYDVYSEASVSTTWTSALVKACQDAGIIFMTSPYSVDLINHIDPYVPAYKVGSGDINWDSIIIKMAEKKKPMLLSCGASTADEVDHAMEITSKYTQDIVLMQCNTNYTASLENFKYCQLNVLKTFALMYPNVVLGLSDHTPGMATTLGAVALGARVIEKHFTDDNNREGPDHRFAMTPATWKEMVDRTRELERAMGNGVKKVEDNERETVVLQRRSVRAKCDLSVGTKITEAHLDVLRPCPEDAIRPNDLNKILGKHLEIEKKSGEHFKWNDLK